MKKHFILIFLISLPWILVSQPTANDSIFVFQADTVLRCNTDSLFLDAGDGHDSYLWNTGDETQGIWIKYTDDYVVTVFDGAGGEETDSTYVNLINSRIFVEDNMICFGDTLTMSVTRKRSECLIAYYPFNGDSKDYGGNQYNAFNTGASLTSDRHGNPKSCYSFDGSSDYMFATIDEHTPTMAVSLWFRIPDTNFWYQSNIYPTFFDYGNGQLKSFTKGKKEQYINNGEVGQVALSHNKQGSPGENFEISTNQKPAFEEWHHLYACLDSASKLHEIWIDGVEQINLEIEAWLDPEIGFIYFGRTEEFKKDSSYFIGRLDEISIYNCALDSTEIASVYKSGSVYEYSYEWSTGDTVPSITVNPDTNTTYYITVSDGINTCTDSLMIFVNPEITLTLEQIDIGCPNSDKAKMLARVEGGTPPYEIVWDPRIQFIQGDTLAIGLKDEISYSITVKDHVLCRYEEVFEVETLDLPIVDFTHTPEDVYIQNPVVEFMSESEDAQLFAWDFGDAATSTEENPVHVYETVETFTCVLKVTAENGCIDSTDAEIDVKEVELVIPNVFTPNGDGINETLVITDLDKYISNQLVIYNRWGSRVFEQNDYVSGEWDGGNLGDGTYFFVLKCVGYFGDDTFQGTLNIIRNPN